MPPSAIFAVLHLQCFNYHYKIFIAIIHFVIHELFKIPVMHFYVLPKISISNKPLQISKLHAETSSQLFHSLSKALICKNSCNKASRLLFIFIHVRTGHTHFIKKKLDMHFLGAYKACYSVFQFYKPQKNPLAIRAGQYYCYGNTL